MSLTYTNFLHQAQAAVLILAWLLLGVVSSAQGETRDVPFLGVNIGGTGEASSPYSRCLEEQEVSFQEDLAIVVSLVPNGPAWNSGLRNCDAILANEGKETETGTSIGGFHFVTIDTAGNLRSLIAASHIGQVLELHVRRVLPSASGAAGTFEVKELTIYVRLGSRKETVAETATREADEAAQKEQEKLKEKHDQQLEQETRTEEARRNLENASNAETGSAQTIGQKLMVVLAQSFALASMVLLLSWALTFVGFTRRAMARFVFAPNRVPIRRARWLLALMGFGLFVSAVALIPTASDRSKQPSASENDSSPASASTQAPPAVSNASPAQSGNEDEKMSGDDDEDEGSPVPEFSTSGDESCSCRDVFEKDTTKVYDGLDEEHRKLLGESGISCARQAVELFVSSPNGPGNSDGRELKRWPGRCVDIHAFCDAELEYMVAKDKEYASEIPEEGGDEPMRGTVKVSGVHFSWDGDLDRCHGEGAEIGSDSEIYGVATYFVCNASSKTAFLVPILKVSLDKYGGNGGMIGQAETVVLRPGQHYKGEIQTKGVPAAIMREDLEGSGRFTLSFGASQVAEQAYKAGPCN